MVRGYVKAGEVFWRPHFACTQVSKVVFISDSSLLPAARWWRLCQTITHFYKRWRLLGTANLKIKNLFTIVISFHQ